MIRAVTWKIAVLIIIIVITILGIIKDSSLNYSIFKYLVLWLYFLTISMSIVFKYY